MGKDSKKVFLVIDKLRAFEYNELSTFLANMY